MESKERWKLLKHFLVIDSVSSQSNLYILLGFTELQKYRNEYTCETKKMEKSSIKIIATISKVHWATIGNSKHVLEFSLSLKAQQLKGWQWWMGIGSSHSCFTIASLPVGSEQISRCLFYNESSLPLPIHVCVSAQLFSLVQFFATLWTVACQAPVSVRFFRQEYWSGLPFFPPGNLSNLGTEPTSPVSPALQMDSLPVEPLKKSFLYMMRP